MQKQNFFMQNKKLKIILLSFKQKKLIEKLDLRRKEHGESIGLFARDIKLIGYRAYPKLTDHRMLESIMIRLRNFAYLHI